MRKRKSPIVLVTLLVVVVAGVVGFNFATSKPGGSPADAPPPPPEVQDVKPIGAARSATKATDVAASLKGTMSATKPSATSEGGPQGPPGAPKGPMILDPARAASMKPEKPKPNSSSTSAQWYNDESAMSKNKG